MIVLAGAPSGGEFTILNVCTYCLGSPILVVAHSVALNITREKLVGVIILCTSLHPLVRKQNMLRASRFYQIV